jgi:hypothetical protein
MDENVLREVIARIMADPRLQPLLAAATAKSSAQKHNCLVVIENAAGLCALPEIQKQWSSCAELQLCVAGPISVPSASLPQISCENATDRTDWGHILLPVCSAQQLGEVVCGFRRDKVTDLIAWAILQGIPVEIGYIEYGFSEKTPDAYRRLLEGYVEKAAAYGVTISKGSICPAPAVVISNQLASPLPWSFGEPVHSTEPETRSAVRYEKNLMTEKEAILLPEHAVLMLNKSTVLTPSAIDTLKRQKVQVYKEGVRFL